MSVKLKPLDDQIMVITGASSGIGLATAKEAARQGARLVLASRNEEALKQIVTDIENEGGQATYQVADVGKKEDLEKVATKAKETYGGFDTWVNNAGVSIYGRLTDVSDEDSRRLFDTNFWGVVNGSLTAAEHLRNRGGAIINIGSVLSDVSIPIQGMYSASKHAVKGFTNALRVELEDEEAPISVTLIKPSAINTPYPSHAKNYTSQEVTLPPPIYAPEEVANAILHAAEHPQRDIIIGGGGRMMNVTQKIAPGLMDWINEKFMISQQFKDRPASQKEGSLHKHGKDGKIHGDHEGHVMKTSLYTRAAMHPVLTSAAAVAAAGAIALLSNRK